MNPALLYWRQTPGDELMRGGMSAFPVVSSLVASGDGPDREALLNAIGQAIAAPVASLLVLTRAPLPAAELLLTTLRSCVAFGGRLELIGDQDDDLHPVPKRAVDAYDAILFLDPAWGRSAVDACNRARHYLRPGGVLAFAGLAHARVPATSADRWPVLEYVRAQARRCGFSPMAAKEPAKEAVRPPPADGLPRLVVGHCCALAPPRWTVNAFKPTDAVAMCALFAAVFAPNALSAGHWHWKYGNGRGLGMAAWSGGEMVAFYGGLPRMVSFKGRPTRAMQIVDVMVRADQRGILRREGAFFQTTATFIEAYVGYGTEIPFGFGFPTVRHLKVAELLGFYRAVDQLHELTWPCRPGPGDWRYRLQPFDRMTLGREARALDRLWDAMHLSLPEAILGVRDWEYIRHRYVEHPEKNYDYLILRWTLTGAPLALLVLAAEGETWHLRDYVGDIRRLPVAIALLGRAGISRGYSTLSAWITASQRARFPVVGCRDRALDIVIPHNIWTRGPSLDEVRGNWWLMGGDTDFL